MFSDMLLVSWQCFYKCCMETGIYATERLVNSNWTDGENNEEWNTPKGITNAVCLYLRCVRTWCGYHKDSWRFKLRSKTWLHWVVRNILLQWPAARTPFRKDHSKGSWHRWAESLHIDSTTLFSEGSMWGKKEGDNLPPICERGWDGNINCGEYPSMCQVGINAKMSWQAPLSLPSHLSSHKPTVALLWTHGTSAAASGRPDSWQLRFGFTSWEPWHCHFINYLWLLQGNIWLPHRMKATRIINAMLTVWGLCVCV